MPEIVFLPDHVSVKVSAGTSIQEAGRSAGLLLDAPCGGHGLCGKCKVRVGKQEVLACQYQVEEDVTVILPEAPKSTGILVNGMESGFAVFPVKEANLRFQLAVNQLENSSRIGAVKKDIARVSTILRMRELNGAEA